MNVPPILLLCIGSAFALAYCAIITVGWAKTRSNRKTYQEEVGVSYQQAMFFQKAPAHKPQKVKTISLMNNYFQDGNGKEINPDEYDIFVAMDTSEEYPQIEAGDLLFLSKESGKIAFVFSVPDLSQYR